MHVPTLETNPIPRGYHEAVTYKITRAVLWTEPGLKVTRLRLLTDDGFPMYDVSYCHGRLPSGEWVDVDLPFSQLPRKGLMKAIVAEAQIDGVYAEGIGVFGAISILR
jgi:hypothetical protein